MKKILALLCLVFLGTMLYSCGENKKTNVEITIDNFIEHQLGNYIDLTKERLEYHVVAGLGALKKLNNTTYKRYIAKEEVETVFNVGTFENPTAYLAPAMVYKHLFQFECDEIKKVLSGYQEQDIYYSEAYVAIMLDTFDVNNSLSTILKSKLPTTMYPSADYAGTAMLALFNEEYDSTPYEAMIHSGLSEAGVLGYNQTPSACSTAYTIMGLIAKGIDPNQYVVGNNTYHLVDALLSFSLEDGSFKEHLTDTLSNLAYATPQAFAALTAYQVFLTTKSAYAAL